MHMYKSLKLVVRWRNGGRNGGKYIPHTGIQLRVLPYVSMLLMLELKSHHYYICLLLIINYQ